MGSKISSCFSNNVPVVTIETIPNNELVTTRKIRSSAIVLHCILLRNLIPIELRHLILNCYWYKWLNNNTIHDAVTFWITKPAKAILVYGHISNWDTSLLTDMTELFKEEGRFNDDIS